MTATNIDVWPDLRKVTDAALKYRFGAPKHCFSRLALIFHSCYRFRDVQASNVMHIMNSTPQNAVFIHVCLFIAFFGILVFCCLESDYRSRRLLRHCSLVNSSIKYNCSFANNKVCTAKRCYAVATFNFNMFWANVYCLWFFFLRKPLISKKDWIDLILFKK